MLWAGKVSRRALGCCSRCPTGCRGDVEGSAEPPHWWEGWEAGTILPGRDAPSMRVHPLSYNFKNFLTSESHMCTVGRFDFHSPEQ